MSLKRIIPCIFLKHKKAVTWFDNDTVIAEHAIELARTFNDNGADELIIFNLAETEDDQEEALHYLKRVKKVLRIPMTIAGQIDSLEDVKKAIYTGARKVVIDASKPEAETLIIQASQRFGKERICASVKDFDTLFKHQKVVNERCRELLVLHTLDLVSLTNVAEINSVIFTDSTDREQVMNLLAEEKVRGITGSYVSQPDLDFYALKEECIRRGIAVSSFECDMKFSDLKANEAGLVPVIVQEYQTGEVLMMAYMNGEAFEQTIKSGKMTYYSRSRQCLWVKGETSGHTQYLKSLHIDCDNDTLLAKVEQVGAACHTGNHSCFYRKISGETYEESNPLQIFKELYEIIEDRREHWKEGSYTNYLFDKGIDKILKKVGEEAAEIIIASKNPNTDEIKYEISDFLYHLTVLMVDKGITWEEIIDELADR